MWDDLICPFDYGTLDGWGSWLSCRRCGRGYPVVDSIPTFLPTDESEEWLQRQRQLVSLMVDSPDEAQHPWSRTLQRRGRAVEARLKEHIDIGLHTKMLQVGLRGQGEIHHFQCGIRYGIDPLAGVMADRGLLKWGQVRWASARGEELPFPSQNFQAILLCDVLGCVESPERALNETRRCLADDGLLLITLPSRVTRGRGSRTVRKHPTSIKPLRRVNRHRVLKWCGQAGFEHVWSGNSEVARDDESCDDSFHRDRLPAPRHCFIMRVTPKAALVDREATHTSNLKWSPAKELADK